MILTSNRSFAASMAAVAALAPTGADRQLCRRWGEVFGDPVVATALLDCLLHNAVVVQIEGSSYRLRQHAELMPEHVRSKALIARQHPHQPSSVADARLKIVMHTVP